MNLQGIEDIKRGLCNMQGIEAKREDYEIRQSVKSRYYSSCVKIQRMLNVYR